MRMTLVFILNLMLIDLDIFLRWLVRKFNTSGSAVVLDVAVTLLQFVKFFLLFIYFLSIVSVPDY
jgi:hypothetical protein